MNDIERFRSLAQPPEWALKRIGGGRLKGMTDIKPAWRIQAMTEVYGLCGIGWKYEVVKQWTEPGPDDQVFAFVDVLVYVKNGQEWSAPIPGTGGNMLIEKEQRGLHANDEAFKMATTDALSSAMRMIGMGADVYAGQWDGSKYARNAEPAQPPVSEKNIADLIEAITSAEDMVAFKTILEGEPGKPPVYQRLKANGPKDQYDRVSKLAKAKHAVLKGQEHGNSGSNQTADQG